MVIVLIETLWNVKSGRKDTIETAVARINRNIVECKVHDLSRSCHGRKVLIETLWNVKHSSFRSVCSYGA